MDFFNLTYFTLFCSWLYPPVLNYKPNTISKSICFCIIKNHLVHPCKSIRTYRPSFCFNVGTQ